MPTNEWVPPTSLDEAHVQRRLVIGEIQNIQAQLSDRRRKANTDPEEYFTWRQGAIWAMTNRLQDLRLVKEWIKENSDG